jgi:hypothetical protein
MDGNGLWIGSSITFSRKIIHSIFIEDFPIEQWGSQVRLAGRLLASLSVEAGDFSSRQAM